MSIVTQHAGLNGEFEPSLACAQAGCAECMEALLSQNTGLIYAVIWRQYYEERDYADLVQEGRIGLWRALQTYKPELGCPFGSYAWVVIERRIWAAVGEAMTANGWIEIESEQDLERVVDSCWEGEQMAQALEGELECLPERLRQVVVEAYGLEGQWPRNLAAIGREMGVTRERVRQMRNEALVILRLPVLSGRVRRVREADSRQAYRAAQRMNREWQRSQRGQR